VTWTDGWDFFGGYEHPGSLGSGGAGGDASGKAVKMQLFTAAGARLGSEVLVNTTTTNYQQASAITALTDGGFIVGWEDGSTTMDSMGAGGGPSIKAQVLRQHRRTGGQREGLVGRLVLQPPAGGPGPGRLRERLPGGYYYDPASVVVRMHDAGGNAQGGQVTLPLGGQGAGAQWTAAPWPTGAWSSPGPTATRPRATATARP
jgi:hypothetical protein